VLGIEPTNAPLFGPDREGAGAGAPVLEPGEQLLTGFTLSFRPSAGLTSRRIS